MMQGIAAYRLTNRNDSFLVFIDEETWLMETSGRTEFWGDSRSPCEVAGTRMDSLDNLPDTVRELIAARCEVLDAQDR